MKCLNKWCFRHGERKMKKIIITEKDLGIASFQGIINYLDKFMIKYEVQE